ncbi:MAG: metallophosphatase family protein [Chloroflexi bacterium]|nr:metallophosphatase family protein [Chloroflexota bacterium]
MKALVISDIHANLTALEVVLDDAGHLDVTWLLGDLVGYGPDPNECIARVRELPDLVCLMGNHDAATLGLINTSAFNPAARIAIHWTRDTIRPENLDYLSGLPKTIRDGDITMAHGSPRQPIWEYLLDIRNATENFKYFDTSYCFVGHTHLPTIYQLSDEPGKADWIIPETDTPLTLSPRAIINPGSVGQPRDHDPRASYAIFDTETSSIEYRRVSYDIHAVQTRMREADLPKRHIDRLSAGW